MDESHPYYKKWNKPSKTYLPDKPKSLVVPTTYEKNMDKVKDESHKGRELREKLVWRFITTGK